MEITKSIFREYDIRGIYPDEINEKVMTNIAKGIAIKCQREGVSEICVGRDGRISGKNLLTSLSQSLESHGIDVINLGLVTTPLLYFGSQKQESKSGVMITGSHNPKNYNGVKLIINDKPVSGSEIYNLIDIDATIPDKLGVTSFQDIKEEYINEVKENIDLKSGKKIKVVIDCGNGAAGCIAPRLFNRV